MHESVLLKLELALATGDISTALPLLKNWLSHAERGAPEKLLQASKPAIRPKIALLMRDLLSRFPSTVVGVPVLIYARPEASGQVARSLQLPPASQAIPQPCSELRFLGWLPSTAQLPVIIPFQASAYNTSLPWLTITSAVALFRSHPDVFEAESLEVPYTWWGDVFASVDGSIRMAGNRLYALPDALEAVRVMHASASRTQLPEHGDFLSTHDRSIAISEGTTFFDQCRQLIEEDI